MSEIEGKAARVAAKERGQRLSFNPGNGAQILFMASWLPDLNPVDPVKSCLENMASGAREARQLLN
jgi:hypothetical protein